jgi:hypothetical protein
MAERNSSTEERVDVQYVITLQDVGNTPHYSANTYDLPGSPKGKSGGKYGIPQLPEDATIIFSRKKSVTPKEHRRTFQSVNNVAETLNSLVREFPLEIVEQEQSPDQQ